MGRVVGSILEMESSFKEIESSSTRNGSNVEYLGIKKKMRKALKFTVDRSSSASNPQALRDLRINLEAPPSQEIQQEQAGPSNQEEA